MLFVLFVLGPPRWWARRPPPVAALGCCRATHPPSVLRTAFTHSNKSMPSWCWMANAFLRQQFANQHSLETGTSGCAGRRRWSEATGGGSHTPRWRFVRGSPYSARNNATEKPTRVGVRADDVGAQRPEEARIPRDGGFRGGVLSQAHHPKTDTSGCAGRRRRSAATGGGMHTPRWRFRGGAHPQHATTQLRNRHEWVCGPTTSERSDWRRHAYPEMAVSEGEFKSASPKKAI